MIYSSKEFRGFVLVKSISKQIIFISLMMQNGFSIEKPAESGLDHVFEFKVLGILV